MKDGIWYLRNIEQTDRQKYDRIKEDAYHKLDNELWNDLTNKLQQLHESGEVEWIWRDLDFEIHKEGQELEYHIITGLSKELIGKVDFVEDLGEFENLYGEVYDYIGSWITEAERIAEKEIERGQ